MSAPIDIDKEFLGLGIGLEQDQCISLFKLIRSIIDRVEEETIERVLEEFQINPKENHAVKRIYGPKSDKESK